MKLNIIGNCFDLYHGLPSSYYFFACFLIENNYKFYEEIGDRYNLKYMKMEGSPLSHDYTYVVDDMFWQDFENLLGHIDDSFIIEKYDDDLGLEYDDFNEIEMNEYLFANVIKSNFAKWVKKTLDVEENYNEIINCLNSSKNKIEFGINEYFIQFNYTHTLQNIYNIDDERIHYMHGECTDSEGNELIVGHGNDDRISKIKVEISKLNKNFDYSQKMQNDISENECLLKYLEELRKDVKFCQIMSNGFHKNIEDDINHIKLFGLSLSEVDMPYIIDIRRQYPHAHWKFSYYSESEVDRIKEIASNQLNLKENQYKVFKFCNPNANDIQEKLVKLRNIKTW